MTSDAPGWNRRPSVTRTCGRKTKPCAPAPRMTTLDALPPPRRGSEISTTVSFDTSGMPCASRAMAGWLAAILAMLRSMPLCTSVSAERRVMTTLSYSPVVTSVVRKPSSSISTVANTNTTSASPPAVSAVVRRRAHRLRAM
jgi:hypothetical protein